MFLSTTEAAAELGLSDRQVRRAVEAGHIQAEHVGGRLALYERQVFAYKRARSRGRDWSEITREAALDLLSGIETEKIAGSQRSRLKARVRGLDASALAHRLLFQSVSMYDAGAGSAEIASSVAGELGLVGDPMKVLVARDSKRAAAQRRLVSNANGNVAVIEGHERHTRVLEALALYAYGDSRERTAAREWINEQQAAI